MPGTLVIQNGKIGQLANAVSRQDAYKFLRDLQWLFSW
ncbi:hypothetical protein SAMN05444008_111140 [Cnuella takakiae]|uniref:Uncharacterized protein n=1 Tax=Cnuella takakiae TaxID=1302690 RepID=A0A1M5DZ61_9BACT|nr:hypothetical protein SAMN05444008_111140 [Cnuella takakiae]